MDYIYGKLNYEIQLQKVEYTGVTTATATTSINNVARTISVSVPLVGGIFDNTHYRLSCGGNSFNANDNTKFFFGLERTITINSVTYTGSIFQFTNNFSASEEFVIARNGTSDLPLNRANTTWSAIGTTISQPAGNNNWETSQSGNHRITIIILNPNPSTANTNRIVVIEKIA
jgi:hypothetical protein